MSNKRIVIMAAGAARRWGNYMGIPKQMVQIDGEPLLKRMIRLLRERGITDIYVTVNEYGQYGQLDAQEYIKDVNDLAIDRIWGARKLVPCIFLYGDVYYTEEAIDTILSDVNDFRFFGRRFPGKFKHNREIYAIKANDWIIQKAGELRELHKQKKVSNSLGQFLHCYCIGIPINPKTKNFVCKPEEISQGFTDIEDGTEDFDTPMDYRRFLRVRSLTKRGQIIRPSKQKRGLIIRPKEHPVEELKVITPPIRHPIRIQKGAPIKTYYTVAQMNSDVVHKLLPKLPDNIDLIVGIPRDGILVATMISIYRNIPFTDMASFKKNEIYRPGAKHRREERYREDFKTVLVVDDICATGRAIREARAEISKFKAHLKIYTAVVYVNKGNTNHIDFYAEELVRPCHFEWTHGDSVQLPRTIFDMDGLLCADCPTGDDDDGERYLNFLKNTPLKLRPQNIGIIVTWRDEKYRKQTEEWLDQHGITYGRLIMANRKKWKNAIQFKADFYAKSEARLFVDSSARQAEQIAKITGRPAVGYDTNQVFELAPL